MYLHQTINSPIGVNVFGSSLLRVDADYATIDIVLTQLEDKPSKTLNLVRAAAKDLRNFLGDVDFPPKDVRVSRVDLRQVWERPYDSSPRFRGHSAEARFNLVVRDLDKVDEVLLGVVAAVQKCVVDVQDVCFRTTELKANRGLARRRTVEAARAKAEIYAQGGGRALGRLIHIEDVNPDELANRGHTPDIDLSAQVDDVDVAAFDPGSIRIAAAVMATFELTD